jgi:phosphohistidine phosphatase SixA
MVLIYQPPNAHVRISWILLRNAMAAAAVKKIYMHILTNLKDTVATDALIGHLPMMLYWLSFTFIVEQ